MLALLVLLLAPAVPLPAPPVLPEPTPLVREVRPERGRTPGYFLNRRPRARIGGRLGLGVAGFIGPQVPMRAGFALDAMVAGRVPVSRRRPLFTLFPELGYNLVAGARRARSHLFSAGLGLGGSHRGVGVAIIPRFVAGSLLGVGALGVRTGLLAEIVKNGGLGVELSHQALHVAGVWSQAILVTLFFGAYAPRER